MRKDTLSVVEDLMEREAGLLKVDPKATTEQIADIVNAIAAYRKAEAFERIAKQLEELAVTGIRVRS